MAQPLWKTVWGILRKFNLKLPFYLWVCPQKWKELKEGPEQVFIHIPSSIIPRGWDREAPQACGDAWTDQQTWHIRTMER